MYFKVLVQRLSFLAILATPAYSKPLLAADTALTGESPVDLPIFTVTDSKILPPPESWRYAQIEGFEILSNASDREAFRLVHDFQQFHQALVAAWPAAENPSSVPASLILCGSGGKFDAFMPKKKAGSESGLVSLSLRDQEISSIVIDLQTKTLNLAFLESSVGPSASVSSTDDDPSGGVQPDLIVDHYKQLYREYIHFVLSRIEPRSPAWLEEGLSQIFMRMQFSPKEITVGKLEDPNEQTIGGAIEDRDFNVALLHRSLLSFPELFGVAHDSAEALNPIASTWAKQCYAFVHYCLYGNRGTMQKPFLTFIERSSHAPITEAMFKECFGRGYSSMLTDLRGYIEFTVYNSVRFRAKRGQQMADPGVFQFREATQAEIGRLKGEALRLAGNRDAALETMTAPYIRGEREPALLAALGLEELAVSDDTRARKFLENATAAKVVRPRAYLELARLRYAEAIAQPAAPDGKLGAEQIASVLRPLFVARGQRPLLPEVYEAIARAWAHSAAAPTHENLEVVTEGVRRFPRRVALVYQAAQVMSQYGFNEEARAFSELGLKVAGEDVSRERFVALKASLPPSAAPSSSKSNLPLALP